MSMLDRYLELVASLLDEHLTLGGRHDDGPAAGDPHGLAAADLDVGRPGAAARVLELLVLVLLGLLVRRVEEVQLRELELFPRVLAGGQLPDQRGDVVPLPLHLVLGEPLRHQRGLGDGEAVVPDGVSEEALHVLQQVDAAVREVWLLLDLGDGGRHAVLGEHPLLVPPTHHLLLPLASEIFPQSLVSPRLGGSRQTVERQDAGLLDGQLGGHGLLRLLLARVLLLILQLVVGSLRLITVGSIIIQELDVVAAVSAGDDSGDGGAADGHGLLDGLPLGLAPGAPGAGLAGRGVARLAGVRVHAAELAGEADDADEPVGVLVDRDHDEVLLEEVDLLGPPLHTIVSLLGSC